MSAPRVSARTRSRRVTVQALYQWQLAGHDPLEVENQYLEDATGSNLDVEYFQSLLRNITKDVGTLDAKIAPKLDRPLHQLDPIERAILRLATYELCSRPEVPSRVVINEAVELAKVFGGEQSHRYVNSVLDKIAREARVDDFRKHSSI